MGEMALDISGVSKTYRGKVQALRGVSLRVPKGCVFGLLGPNGAGKSTLVKILTTIIRPSQCQGTMLGQAVGHKPTLARVGYLPEHARFPDYLTGAQVVEFSAGLCGLPARRVRKRRDWLLDKVGMGDWQHKKLKTYSKGMKQRVGLAQALINDPEVIFLDEPTDGVDPAGRRDIRLLMAALRDEGRTVFVNSHLLSELEMICDEVAILSQGMVNVQGNLKELTTTDTEFRLSIEGELPAEVEGRLRELGARLVEGQVSVPVGTAKDVMPVMDLLRDAGVTIEGMERRSMSLEDLFMGAVGTDRPGAASVPSKREGGA